MRFATHQGYASVPPRYYNKVVPCAHVRVADSGVSRVKSAGQRVLKITPRTEMAYSQRTLRKGPETTEQNRVVLRKKMVTASVAVNARAPERGGWRGKRGWPRCRRSGASPRHRRQSSLGNTSCCVGGMGISPFRSRQSIRFSVVLSAASAREKSILADSLAPGA